VLRRLNEGLNQAIHHIGYSDNGRPFGLSDAELEESIYTLWRIAHSIDCNCSIQKILLGEHFLPKSLPANVRRFLVAIFNFHLNWQIPVAVVGAYGSGTNDVLHIHSHSCLLTYMCRKELSHWRVVERSAGQWQGSIADTGVPAPPRGHHGPHLLHHQTQDILRRGWKCE
jgi:hypothetical protein